MSNFNEELKELEQRSKLREKLIKRIVKDSEIIQNFPDNENFLVLSRQWNSWYPSSLDVEGGCYFFNINDEIIIIDPGFNTIEEIKKNQLDIRLIRHVFITHFHPDHFESLVKIITRITSKNNPITVYMNSTAFDQFKIYSKEYTDFIELKPGMVIKLDFKKDNPKIMVNVEVNAAYHKEIGGANNSIGLKFKLIDKYIKKVHVIGFMSDTDGSEKYIDEYCSFYGNCDILVIHIGSIDKHPTGYKHLYKDGIISLFNRLSDQNLLENKYIFIGEFGFELAQIDFFLKACEAIIPERLNYLIIINSFLDFLNKKEPEISLGYIYVSSFMKCIDKISFLYPTLEIVAPFFFNLNDDPDAIIKESIISIDVKDVQIGEIWEIFTQTIVFESMEPSSGKEKLEKIGFKIFGNELVKEFYSKIHTFFKYMNILITAKFLNRIRKNEFIDFLNPEDISKFIKYYVQQITHEELSSEPYYVIRQNFSFSKINILSKLSKEEKQKLDIISLLIFSLFMIYLANFNDFIYPSYGEVDGRQIICKNLYSKYDLGEFGLVLPVHPSYRMIFSKEIVELEGSCTNGHRKVRHLITDYNRDWILQHKRPSSAIRKDLEFIDVFSTNYCTICIGDSLRKENGRTEEEIERERFEDITAMKEQFEAQLQTTNMGIKEAKDLLGIVITLFKINKPVLLSSIDGDLLIEKIIELRKEVPNEELLNVLFTSKNFINIQQVRTLIKEIIEEEAKDNESFVKSLILSLLSNDLAKENGDIYYNYFEYDDLNDSLIKYQPEFDLQEIIEISNYFIGKINYLKTKEQFLTLSKMFFYYKRQFINLFYKILKFPESHVNELELIFSENEFVNNLHTIPQPINFYAKCIKNQKIKYIMEKRRASRHKVD